MKSERYWCEKRSLKGLKTSTIASGNIILRTFSYYVIIILRHFYYFYQAAVAINIRNLLICFCSFNLS